MAFGTVTGVIGLLNLSRQLINEIREQCRRIKKVPNKCNQVEMGLDEIGKILHELKDYKQEKLPEMGRRQVESMSKYLEKAKHALEKEQNRAMSASRTRRFFRARRVSETLDELINGLKTMKQEGLMCGLSAHQAVLLQASSSGVRQDVFVAIYNIPPTPAELVLDLNNSETYEGQLKQKVLSGNSKTVGAVGARVTAAQGMSGVGKTCAVTAVGNDGDVQKYYSGGVYFLSFGQDATDGDVMSTLANKVEESGGHQVADKIQNENRLSSAIEKGRSWFSSHKCLFICDDMW